MTRIAALLLFHATVCLAASAQDEPLLSGRDVEFPKRLHAPAPTYPPIALEARVQGVILIKLRVGVDGRPSNLMVYHGIPLLDVAAAEAVKTWRYQPTVVDSVPRRVELVEAVGFSSLGGTPMAYPLDEGQRARAFADIAVNDHGPQAVRLLAISQLAVLPSERQKRAAKTLRRLENAKDPAVADAASSALAKLAVEVK